MVKPLRFKGEKRVKKRKAAADPEADADEASTTAVAKRPKPDNADTDDDGWVDSEIIEDLNGPLIFCFSANKPVCLACDTMGTVFASPLDGVENEDLSTAEPHDIQQVWVCTKIYGTEKYSLKSASGKYLGCDKVGVLSATREAISPEEEWVPVKSELSGRWALQTVRDTFLRVEEKGNKVEVRGDAEDVGFRETWHVRLQKRNKVKSKKEKKEEGMERISRKELEELVGLPLDEEQVKTLRRARRKGGFHEAMLDIRVKKGKHDKYAY